jgi:hypothetical protein
VTLFDWWTRLTIEWLGSALKAQRSQLNKSDAEWLELMGGK